MVLSHTPWRPDSIPSDVTWRRYEADDGKCVLELSGLTIDEVAFPLAALSSAPTRYNVHDNHATHVFAPLPLPCRSASDPKQQLSAYLKALESLGER